MNLLIELYLSLLKRVNSFTMPIQFALKVTLFERDFYELTFSKMEKKLANIFPLKVNGVIHPEVLEQDNPIFTTSMQLRIQRHFV